MASSRPARVKLKDGSVWARQLLDGSHSVVAGRLAGAFGACGRDTIADEVLPSVRSVGNMMSEMNPFAEPQS